MKDSEKIKEPEVIRQLGNGKFETCHLHGEWSKKYFNEVKSGVKSKEDGNVILWDEDNISRLVHIAQLSWVGSS